MPAKASVVHVQKHRKNAITIALWLFILHIIAITQFTRGFLLTRPVLPTQSEVIPLIAAPFKRAVILVVDALRYDFIKTPAGAPDAPYLRHFPLTELCDDPQHCFTLRFMADPPTTTLQRLKGLTTGSLPAFVDAGSNFAGFKIEEDNWVSQAAKHLGPVSFVGDDTWEALFAHTLSENYPYPSLNVRDLDTVDNGVKEHLGDMIRNQSNKVVIGHMLGVDHVGHRYGPSHPAMSSKLDETFGFVKGLVSLVDEDTVLLVFGDHGMDQTGNHGGDSNDELSAGLWAYSKRPVFRELDNIKQVDQIDLVPTISGWLGLPIPYNSLGYPIPHGFASTSDFQKIVKVNDHQIRAYAEDSKMDFAKREVEKEIASLRARDVSIDDEDLMLAFQERMLVKFKEAWAQFDIPKMRWGVGILTCSVFASLLLYTSISLPLLAPIATGQTRGALAGTGLGLVFNIAQIRQSWLLYLIAASKLAGVGILVMTVIPLLISPKFSLPSRWSLIAMSFLIIEAVSAFANSFVIWESKIQQFLIATCLVALSVSSAASGSALVTYLGLWYSGVLLVLTRLSSSWVLCREETASRCETTFFDLGSSLVPTWTLFVLGIVGLILPYLVVRYWQISKNNVGITNLILNITPLAVALSIGYWSLDNAEARNWIAHDAFGLQNGKLLLARLALVLGAGGGLVIWWRSSLPIEVVLSKEGSPDKISGYHNIFGGYGLLSVVCIFWSLLVTNKPPAALALSALLYSCLAVLDLVDITRTKYTLMTPVLMDLLAHGYFYYTGHQATIPSIQWDIAFIASRTVKFPWSPISVMLNTFGPFILCAVVSVFSALWRRTPFKDPVQPLVFVLRAASGLIFVVSLRTLTSVISAYNFRRHLMSWKIFAPRFMLGSMTLLICDLSVLLALVLSGHTIKKVSEIFG